MKKSRLDKLQGLLAANDIKAAEKLCRRELGRNPADANMIALLGAVLLKAGKLKEAEQRLREAIALAPKFAKPYDDLGVLLLRREEFQEAEEVFRSAVTLMPNLGSSWFGLVHALKGQRNFPEAERICRMILDANPNDPTATRLLAGILAEDGDVPGALDLLQGAVDKHPGSVVAVTDLATFCAEQFNYTKAIEMYRRATEMEPGRAEYHFDLGRNLFTVGRHADALSAYERGLAIEPQSPGGLSGRLYALRSVGRSKEVVDGYRKCIGAGINVGESWWALSSLRTYSFSDQDVDSMRQLRGTQSLSDADGQYLDFALGKALDDREQYDEAWKHYVSGNDARRRSVFYDGVQFESKVDAIITALDENTVSRGENIASQAVTPIFVIGMPRSGSTLVEQMLASHEEVEATTELPYLAALARRSLFASDGGADAPVIGMNDGELADLGARYLKSTELNRLLSRPYFVDKEPENYLYAGLIAMILPGAKIIDARRNPLDTCIGNFRQWFASGKEFSYDLYELADYYLQYWRLMQYWNDIMPGKILRVDYEKVVANTEMEVRRIVDWCGLPWDERCLRFHESGRVVTSASSEQVRQPIYKSGVGFWKHYEAHLEELREILDSVIE